MLHNLPSTDGVQKMTLSIQLWCLIYINFNPFLNVEGLVFVTLVVAVQQLDNYLTSVCSQVALEADKCYTILIVLLPPS